MTTKSPHSVASDLLGWRVDDDGNYIDTHHVVRSTVTTFNPEFNINDCERVLEHLQDGYIISIDYDGNNWACGITDIVDDSSVQGTGSSIQQSISNAVNELIV